MAGAEELVPFACIGADEIAHVLHQSQDRHAQPLGHAGRLAYHHARQILRRTDQHHAAHGQRLHHRQRSVGSARRQVYDQPVQIAPEDVAPELPDGSADQRPAPDHRVVLVGQQQVDGHDFDARLCLGGQNAQRALTGPDAVGKEHLGDAGAGDVGIEHADPFPLTAQGHCQQAADQRFAHASLAAHHGDDPFDVVKVLGDSPFIRVANANALFFFDGHLRQLDVHRFDPLQGQHCRPRLGYDLLFQGTGQRGQGQREAHLPAFDLHVLDHPQFHQAAIQLRVFDPSQRINYLFLCKHVTLSLSCSDFDAGLSDQGSGIPDRQSLIPHT